MPVTPSAKPVSKCRRSFPTGVASPRRNGDHLSRDGIEAEALCQSCGACCAFSREWPRFSLESDAALDLIPARFVDDSLGRMRCDGDRCAALVGEVAKATSCAIYSVRPDVCRACLPGDDACLTARQRFNL